ncbi:hypothetical protein RJ639_040122, partial [Escallonia herrerae]
MGAIGEEDVMKWEKMQGGGTAREEKILVLVRLRPLSEKEIARNEVSDWECINNTSILFRNSLQERSMFPTAYTFDRVFGGDCSTREVYEAGAKEIALSVVSASIFAYGQTSSGKTYTMVGITEYTVADIYEYIQRHEERAFVLKFSAIEIYNEAVRDLLSTDNMPLRLLDDPEKGTIVEKLTEETLRDWNHLKELLSVCEAQRKIGETSLNETSSRSHQILRLTIESSAREFLGKDKSTTLAASVNFVDLAGSERASQALSVGQRLKEGCHINRSLLTLSTVIRKLSKGRNGHVNYRDSKLTRILQPSLGGNARTGIICTLSPARSHVEQSRNTLLFASCAKEVTTNAQVNVVMSDKALVKHLQKELARLESELRAPGSTSTCDYAALLRKKDLQIEKLGKEVKELTKQLDLAQSRVEELLQVVRDDKASRQRDGHKGKTWEDDHSVSESSDAADSHSSGRNNGRNAAPYGRLQKNDNDEDSSILGGSSSMLSKRSRLVRYNEGFALDAGEDSDDVCKEVRCIEMDESSNSRTAEPLVMLNGENEGGISASTVSASGEVADQGLSSIGSAYFEEQNGRNDKTSGDEDVPSVHTFVAGLKEMKLQYEKQLHGHQVEETELADRCGKNVKDVGLDPMHDSFGTPPNWSLEFERQQLLILALWQICNVSLIHRTYFFLLFKGDPTDSIYMEVEVRRLSFLKETFLTGNSAVEGGRILTTASSMKALRREREMLSRLMYKRFTHQERNRFYEKWGISINSKRRRLQLVQRLWSDTEDTNHVKESAAIVAKLIRFSEQGQAVKETFGLSFTPP